MSDTPRALDVLRTPKVLVSIIVAVVVVIVWLVAFFLPQGSKVSTLNGQIAALTQKVKAGNAKVAQLKVETQTTPALTRRLNALHAYIPTTPGIYSYFPLMQATAAKAGVTLKTIGNQALVAPSSSSSGSSVKSGTFSTIAWTVTVTGTYDHLLTFITDIYKMPRLTLIDTLTINGGGPGTTRGTKLVATMTLTTFSSYKPTTSSSSA